jgi:hypothetical protein
MNDPNMYLNLKPRLEEDPLLLSHISAKFKVLLEPWDKYNWSSGPVRKSDLDNGYIEGPAETKETARGFIMFHNGSGFSQPISLKPSYPFGIEAMKSAKVGFSFSASDILTLRKALACLFDAHILPRKEALLDINRRMQELTVKSWILPEQAQEVLLKYLEVARATALSPSKVIMFERQDPVSHQSDPISLRLWRKWGKYIQGSVHPSKGLGVGRRNILR